MRNSHVKAGRDNRTVALVVAGIGAAVILGDLILHAVVAWAISALGLPFWPVLALTFAIPAWLGVHGFRRRRCGHRARRDPRQEFV